MSEIYNNVIRIESERMNEEEITVVIYESIDSVRDCDFSTDTNTQQPLQSSGSECVKIRSYRAVTVCLILLCVLLLTAVIVLCVLINTNNHNLTEERDQLLTKIRDLDKQNGWLYYQSSFYFISTELKNWNESRRYCREREADLVIINNREEQDFVKRISGTKTIWIGRCDSDVEDTFKWADNSTLNSGFSRSGDPNKRKTENCVGSYLSEWKIYSCNSAFYWICEKMF